MMDILERIVESGILESGFFWVAIIVFSVVVYFFTRKFIHTAMSYFGRAIKMQIKSQKEEKKAERITSLIESLKTASIGAITHEMQILIAMGEAAVDSLIEALRDKHPRVRWIAAKVLGEINDPRRIKPLIETSYDSDSSVRLMATTVLSKIDDVTVVDPLIVRLKDSDRYVRLAALQSFLNERIDCSRAVEALMGFLKDEENSVRRDVARILGKTKDSRAVGPLIVLLNDHDWIVQEQVVFALREIKDARAVAPLIKMLDHETLYLRAEAAKALAELGDPIAAEPLKKAIDNEENREIKHSLSTAWEKLVKKHG